MNWYILTIIPILGLLVFVHELGHFLTAKWAGIRVEEFGMGFPPTLIGFRKRERGGWEVMWFGRSRAIETNSSPVTDNDRTIYSLNMLPIGGFVRMSGESGDVYDEHGRYDSRSFGAQSANKRFIVLVAGVVMNLILAIILFTVAYTIGQPAGFSNEPVLGSIGPGTPAEAAGLRPDDRILSVNGISVHTFQQMHDLVGKAIDKAHTKQKTVPITLVISPGGSSARKTVIVHALAHPSPNQGYLGVDPKTILITIPFWQAPLKGLTMSFNIMGLIIITLSKMLIGLLPLQLSGPVGIAQTASNVAQSVNYVGWWPLLSLTGMLSLNLAIFNILPFPALDGGRIFLVFLEVLRGGKRLQPKHEGLINFVGMAMLLLLMVVVTISDVMHWDS